MQSLQPVLQEFSSVARHGAKESGLLADDAAHVFELTRPQLNTKSSIDASVPLHFGFVMGNCILGKEAEYDTRGTMTFTALRCWALQILSGCDAAESPKPKRCPEMRSPPIAWSYSRSDRMIYTRPSRNSSVGRLGLTCLRLSRRDWQLPESSE
jgi:hypothetical protein